MNKILKTILTILITLAGVSMPAFASYIPFNTNVNMNVGIGTTTPQGGLVVPSGNVGIGTWAPIVPLQIVGIGTQAPNGGGVIINNGNVGIGTTVPGSALYVGNGVITSYSTLATSGEGIVTYAGNGKAINMQAGTANANILYDNTGGFSFQSVGRGQVLAGISSSTSITMNIDTNGNVGIGTVSALFGGLIVQNGNVGFGTFFPQAGLAVMNGNVGIGTWTAKGGNLIVNGGGNVGIGSAWPGTMLDVQGTVRALNFIGNGSGLTNLPSSNYWLNDTAGNVGISTIYAVGIGTTFVGGTGEAALSVMNGNVGIGTWIPSGTLEVDGGAAPANTAGSSITIAAQDATGPANNNGGSINFFAGSGAGSFGPGNISFSNVSGMTESRNSTDGYSPFGGPIGLSFTIANSFAGNNNDSILNFTAVNSTPNNQAAYIGAVSAPGAGNFAPYLIFGQTIASNSYYERMRLDSLGNLGIGTTIPQGGLVVMNGNVGIGTWVPGLLLDVNGTVRMKGLTLTGNGAANGNVLVSNSVGVGTWMPSNTLATSAGSNFWLLNGGAGNIGINTSYAVGIGTTFVGGTGEAALSVMNGNVGIGTWVPTTLLSLAGTGTTNGISMNNGGDIIYDNSSEVDISIAGVQRMTLNVGTLQFNAGVSPGFAGPQAGVVSVLPRFPDNTVGLSWDNTGILGLHGGNNTTDAMTINNGNVGIGTIAPLSKLSVNGGVGIGTSLTNIAYLSINSAPPGGLIVQGNVGIGTFSPFGGGLIVLPFNTGNVGIGSLTPGTSLDVSGTVRMTGLTLTGNGAASGNVLVSNSIGVGTWMPSNTLATSAGSNFWLLNGGAGNIGINTSYAVGIGTTFVGGTGEASLAVMNGNTGIGTWVPLDIFQVGRYKSSSGGFEVDSNGNVGIGTVFTSQSAFSVLSGNVGIGTWVPSQQFEVGEQNFDVTSFGNVGIQNSLPSVALEVGSSNSFPGAPYQIFASSWSNGAQSYPQYLGNWNTNGIWGIGPATTSNTDPTLLIGAIDDPGPGMTWANDINLNLVIPGNIGIGVKTSAGMNEALYVNGNVGIGTITATGGNLIVKGGGNVGIATTWPGQALDVQGTIRMTGLTLTGNGAANGNVLVSNGVGVGTWMPAGTLATSSGSNFWLLNGGAGNIGINTSYAVGIGTAFVGGTGEATLSVMNGNVGIGTWVPAATLDVNGGFRTTGTTGNTTLNTSGGNVGIGSAAPGQLLDVAGNIRGAQVVDTGIAASNLVYADSGQKLAAVTLGSGLTLAGSTLSLASGTNLWSLTAGAGNVGISTIYSVGIGTSSGVGAGLVVMNGNVGIGTWVPVVPLMVTGTVPNTFGSVGSNDIVTSVFNANPSANGTNWIILNNNKAGDVSNSYGMAGGGTVRWEFGNDLLANGGQNFYIFDELAAKARLYIDNNGNVGISSTAPGQLVDVQGTVRTIGLTMSGQTPVSGYVLTASDSAGDATWSPSSSVGTNYWNYSAAGNIGVSTIQAVGIGTTFIGGTGEAALSVMNGFVGIGTWLPANALDVENGNIIISNNNGITFRSSNGNLGGTVSLGYSTSNALILNQPLNAVGTPISIRVGQNPVLQIVPTGSSADLANIGIGTITPVAALSIVGNVGIGTGINSSYLTTTPPSGGMIIQGNVGIGSLAPGQALDVTGTVRAIGLTMSGQTPVSGYVLTANDSAGDVTWTAPGVASGWTVSGNNVYETSGGNVGIGTINPFGGALIVTNGNVGIGTLVPGQLLDVKGTIRNLGELVNGNVGIGTTFVNGAGEGALTVMNGNVGIGTWLPSQLLQVGMGGAGTNNTGFRVNSTGDITSISGFVAATLSHSNQNFYYNGTVSIGNVYSSGTSNTQLFGGSFASSALTLQSAGFATGTSDYINFMVGNVGIGTIEAMRIVNGGNVGIGTWLPRAQLDVQGTLSEASFGGNVGIGTWINYFGVGLSVMQGSVGIGTIGGGAALDIAYSSSGTDAIHFTNTRPNGRSWAIGDSVNSPPGPGNFEITDNTINVDRFVINSVGNIGIGTVTPAGGFVVMNGNVGIGTWAPAYTLESKSGDWHIGNFANLWIDSGSTINFGPEGSVVPQITGSFLTPTNFLGLSIDGTANSLVIDGSGNIGIGTDTPIGGFLITNGNVGIGTWTAMGGQLIVRGPGNVGIGSAWPGKTLDINGTARMTGFILTGNGAAPGSVMITNSIGVGTWMPINTIAAGGVVNSQVANEIAYYNSPSPSQTIVGSAGMIFNNGNVGLGTVTPAATLSIVGNIGIGTVKNGDNYINTTPPNGGVIVEGNVGIGTWAPLKPFSVTGDSYHNGNIGIGTIFIGGAGEGALTVMNGNVGIGTWTPAGQLDVEGTLSVIYLKGNVGIGTFTVPAYNLDLVNGTARQRNVRRVQTTASSASLTINSDITDLYTITALAANITFNNPTGTPNNGDLLEIRMKDNATARTIAWGANFASTTTTLPATTVISTWLRILLEWSSDTSKWECIGVT